MVKIAVKPIFALKKWFFDRQLVQAKIEEARLKVLSKIGAVVMTRAKRSIRRQKKRFKKIKGSGQVRVRSEPDKPPFSWVEPGIRMILFAYDPSRDSVFVGPIKFGGKGSGTAPETLEYGGMAPVTAWRRKKGGKASMVKRKAKVAARPFMRPALASAKFDMPALFKDSVK